LHAGGQQRGQGEEGQQSGGSHGASLGSMAVWTAGIGGDGDPVVGLGCGPGRAKAPWGRVDAGSPPPRPSRAREGEWRERLRTARCQLLVLVGGGEPDAVSKRRGVAVAGAAEDRTRFAGHETGV